MTKMHHPHTPPSSQDRAPTHAYQQTVEQTLAAQRSTMAGLSRAEVQARLQQHGPNALPAKKAQTRNGCVFWPILTMS
ncbi:Cation transporter/ATPase, N-terminus [Leclercia adecarboxylata]|uniref:Cation transporter/ATPase, N-terminus n=1 Tax=Leclercia adecarboxylata TaxID=83655 RepID=A0A4U9HQY0_9ENTR|nr:Cation transporter/ATPase, N-terminus [Leclercia adecarboxylata]